MKPKPDEHDSTLFREAIRGVKPLRHAQRVTTEVPRPSPRARFSQTAYLPAFDGIPHGSASDPELAAGDASLFSRPEVTAATLRKLRRGQFRVQVELDLHGLNAAVAKRQLHDFLIECLQRRARCLRIVHGKGLRSGPGGPVLRQLVNSTLRHTEQVAAFASARPADGGTGALYVLLNID